MVVAVRSGGNIVLAETSISYPSPLALWPVYRLWSIEIFFCAEILCNVAQYYYNVSERQSC